ncbi:MAG: PGPGW domain-containing protein [Rhizobiaceae bacterium]
MINKIPRPATKLGRTVVGSLLVVGGILGFLPILGFWMVPLGLIILSQDFARVRRFRRRWSVRIGRWWSKMRSRLKNG